MIITRTFLDKSNTIIKDNYANTGLNPVMELNYGKMLTRGLIHFDHTNLQRLVHNKIYPDITKLKHVLHMTNAACLVTQPHAGCKGQTSEYNQNLKQRAISFDVILFLIPETWDSGAGFDYVLDLYHSNQRTVRTDGSNWYKYRNGHKWSTPGIYTSEFLSKELDKFTNPNGNQSDIIIAFEHFDYGNENLEIDITETVNKYITGEIPNKGIGIAFSPRFEQMEDIDLVQYVGFFTDHTHSFYRPYIETRYDETITDNRNHFVLGRTNKLYFYAFVGGSPVNLDDFPTCTINGVQRPVKQATRGVYYAEVDATTNEFEPDTMYYDEWSNIVYQGKTLHDVEMQFATVAGQKYMSFGYLPTADETPAMSEYIPNISGINDCEQILKGDIRRVNVDCRIPYTSGNLQEVDGLYYRVYVESGGRQIDVISWTPVEQDSLHTYFLLDTKSLVPFRYKIDLKVCQNNAIKHHPNMAEFDIVEEISDLRH